MKKIITFIISIFIFISCDKEEMFENPVPDQELTTKSSGAPSNIIFQLNGIPVNIKLVGNSGDRIYLSTNKKNTGVDLYTHDDGSLRQRWNLSPYMGLGGGVSISGCGGTSYNNYYLHMNSNKKPFMAPTSLPASILEVIPNTNYYYITDTYVENPPTFPATGYKTYLCSESQNSQNLKYGKKNETGNRDRWEIEPVEDFQLLDIRYYQEVTDKTVYSPIYVEKRNFVNEKDFPMNYELNIQESLSETSQFSEVEGITLTNKITNSASFKVGIPIIGGEGSISLEHTSTKNWSYTTTSSTTKSKTVTDHVSFTLPPRKKLIWKFFASRYNLNISYVAKLKGLKSGRIIETKGKWDGTITANYVEINLKDAEGNPISHNLRSRSQVQNSDID